VVAVGKIPSCGVVDTTLLPFLLSARATIDDPTITYDILWYEKLGIVGYGRNSQAFATLTGAGTNA